jgi:hypothetical protein
MQRTSDGSRRVSALGVLTLACYPLSREHEPHASHAGLLRTSSEPAVTTAPSSPAPSPWSSPLPQARDGEEPTPLPTPSALSNSPAATRGTDAGSAEEALTISADPSAFPFERMAQGGQFISIAKSYPGTGGSCALPRLPAAGAAAVPRALYHELELCGACLQVTGPQSTVIVEVVDLCPGCPTNVLDLSYTAHQRAIGATRVLERVKWRLVPCPVQGPIQYHFKPDSSRFWAAFQVRNAKSPIRKVELGRGGDWLTLSRSRDNYFVVHKGLEAGPVRLRVTASNGQELVQELRLWQPGRDSQADGQF